MQDDKNFSVTKERKLEKYVQARDNLFCKKLKKFKQRQLSEFQKDARSLNIYKFKMKEQEPKVRKNVKIIYVHIHINTHTYIHEERDERIKYKMQSVVPFVSFLKILNRIQSTITNLTI